MNLPERNGLELQIALLCARAIESKDPLGHLKEACKYHNLSEYHLHEKGPLRYR